MDSETKAVPVFVVDEAQALMGGMCGQGTSAATRKPLADLLSLGRKASMQIADAKDVRTGPPHITA